MFNYQIIIEYLGTNYVGWQIQKNGVSIQSLVQRALNKTLKSKIKINGSGRTDAGVHALAYPLGGTFHIPHGLSNSLVLPHVLRFNIVDENASRLYAELAPCLFPKMDISSNYKKVSVKFIDNLASLSKELGLEQKLRGLNIPEDACAKMASDAMKQSRLLINNPREITEKDALDIYKLAW